MSVGPYYPTGELTILAAFKPNPLTNGWTLQLVAKSRKGPGNQWVIMLLFDPLPVWDKFGLQPYTDCMAAEAQVVQIPTSLSVVSMMLPKRFATCLQAIVIHSCHSSPDNNNTAIAAA